MMADPRVVRLWVLQGLHSEVVGAVCPREAAADAATNHAPWRAVVSHAGLGESTTRETLDGRRFQVRPVIGPEAQQWTPFETMAAAMAYLENLKDQNVAAGWIESPLNAIDDPD